MYYKNYQVVSQPRFQFKNCGICEIIPPPKNNILTLLEKNIFYRQIILIIGHMIISKLPEECI